MSRNLYVVAVVTEVVQMKVNEQEYKDALEWMELRLVLAPIGRYGQQ